MKDRIEIDGVSYVKEEPKKEIPTKYYIRVIAGEVFLYGTKGDFSWAMPGFESKTITKEEADYASNKPTEGDWEFRVPKEGDMYITAGGRGLMVERETDAWLKDSVSADFLSGRRWVKKEESKKKIIFRLLKVLEGEVLLAEVPDDLDQARKGMYLAGLHASGFESKTISKEEADYASNKPTEGEWEFRVPKKGESYISGEGNGFTARRLSDSWLEGTISANFLSGRRWVKKEEPKKEKINYFIKVVAGEVFLHSSMDTFPIQFSFESKTISKEEADYASNKPTEGEWEFRVPKEGETILGYCGGGHHIKVKSWEEKGPLSGRRWVKKEEPKKEITFEELFKAFQSYYRNAPFCDNMDGYTRVFLERVEKQINAKD